MRFRLWPTRERPAEAEAAPTPVEPESEPEPLPAPAEPEPLPAPAEPEHAPVEEPPPAAAAAPEPEGLPASVSMTLDEAKAAIKAAQGDVIQIGFLASAYQRHREEDPSSSETRAARKRLAELVSQRLKDRDLLAASGSFELRE
jgi:hypothetical protein